MPSRETIMSDHRIEKLEGHVDDIYSEISSLKESNARVEANQQSMGGDIKTLVSYMTKPEKPPATTQWISVGLAFLSIIGALSFAFINPIAELAKATDVKLDNAIEMRIAKDLADAKQDGRNEQKAEDTYDFATSLSTLSKNNQMRVTKTEADIKVTQAEIIDIREMVRSIRANQQKLIYDRARDAIKTK